MSSTWIHNFQLRLCVCVYNILGPKKPRGVTTKNSHTNKEQHTSTSHNRQAKTGPSTNLNIKQPLGVLAAATMQRCAEGGAALYRERVGGSAQHAGMYTFFFKKNFYREKNKRRITTGRKGKSSTPASTHTTCIYTIRLIQ